MKLKKIQQIKKLMLHERSARLIGNIAEADAFVAKIAYLRQKFDITEEIPLEDETDFNPVDGVWSELVFPMSSRFFRNRRIIWQEALFTPCAKYWDCRPIILKFNNLKIVVGEKENRKKTIAAYLYFHPLAEQLAGEHVRDLKKHGACADKKEARRIKLSFLHGFADGISERLFILKTGEMHLKRLEEYAPSVQPVPSPAGNLNSGSDARQLSGNVEDSQPCTALVKSTRILITEKRPDIEEMYGDVKDAPEPKIPALDEDAYFEGNDAARDCELPDDIREKAEKLIRDIEEAEERARRKKEEESPFWRRRQPNIRVYYSGKPIHTTFPVQEGFNFED